LPLWKKYRVTSTGYRERRKEVKLSLPLKLGIFVLVLFALVIATCLLWTPVKIQYYVGKLKSDNPKERVTGVDGLLGMGRKGAEALERILGGGKEEVVFLSKHWRKPVITLKVLVGYEGNLEGQWPLYIHTTPLHLAVENGFQSTVELFLLKGTDVNFSINGVTPLRQAAYKNQLDIARLLIKKGADANTRDTRGQTPLHLAAQKGHKDVIFLLLEKGAYVNSKDDQGSRPLHWATDLGRKDIAALLLEKGADVNAKDITGGAPLHTAAFTNNKDIVELLISKGANVNIKDNSGRTALHNAVNANSKEIITLLLSKGANINVKDSKNRTPLDWANEYTKMEVANLLRTYGAKTGEELKASGVKRQGSGIKEQKK